jgi:RecA/RadA recombinase
MRMVVGRMKRSLLDNDMPTTTVVCVNQIREKVGVMWGSPETAPGGRGKDFAYSLMITLRSSGSDKLLRKVVHNGIVRDVRIGQKVRYAITKNKCSGGQFEEGEFEYYIRENKGYRKFAFNNYDALLKYGLFYNVIKIDVVKEKKAGKMKDVEYMVYGSIRYASEDAFKKKLMEDKKSTFSIYTKILNAVAAENRAKSNVDDDEESEDEIEVPVKAPKTHKKPGKRPLIVINRK